MTVSHAPPPTREPRKRSSGGRAVPGGVRPPAPRAGHVVDLAVLFAELLRAPNVTQADLGRRYRKSAGYVSVVCRLGRALQGTTPEVLDQLRVPHLTLKAAQTLVSRYAEPRVLLGAALRLAATPPHRRTRARVGVPGTWSSPPAGSDTLDPLPPPADRVARPDAFTYLWNPELARRDPAAAAAEFEAYVRATTDEVIARLRRAAGDLGLGANATESPPADGTRFDETSFRLLHQRVRDTLRAHRARMEAFVSDRARGQTRSGRTGPGGTLPPMAVDSSEVDADLA